MIRGNNCDKGLEVPCNTLNAQAHTLQKSQPVQPHLKKQNNIFSLIPHLPCFSINIHKKVAVLVLECCHCNPVTYKHWNVSVHQWKHLHIRTDKHIHRCHKDCNWDSSKHRLPMASPEYCHCKAKFRDVRHCNTLFRWESPYCCTK